MRFCLFFIILFGFVCESANYYAWFKQVFHARLAHVRLFHHHYNIGCSITHRYRTALQLIIRSAISSGAFLYFPSKWRQSTDQMSHLFILERLQKTKKGSKNKHTLSHGLWKERMNDSELHPIALLSQLIVARNCFQGPLTMPILTRQLANHCENGNEREREKKANTHDIWLVRSTFISNVWNLSLAHVSGWLFSSVSMKWLHACNAHMYDETYVDYVKKITFTQI